MKLRRNSHEVRALAWELHERAGHPDGYDGPCWGPTLDDIDRAHALLNAEATQLEQATATIEHAKALLTVEARLRDIAPPEPPTPPLEPSSPQSDEIPIVHALLRGRSIGGERRDSPFECDTAGWVCRITGPPIYDADVIVYAPIGTIGWEPVTVTRHVYAQPGVDLTLPADYTVRITT